MARLILLIYLI